MRADMDRNRLDSIGVAQTWECGVGLSQRTWLLSKPRSRKAVCSGSDVSSGVKLEACKGLPSSQMLRAHISLSRCESKKQAVAT